MFNLMKKFIPKIHKQGYYLISIFAVISFLLLSFSQLLGFLAFILTAWCIFFFRDPDRVILNDKNIIISAADGIVQKIQKAKLPQEIAFNDTYMNKISIFLNIFNVHVNRIPVTGKIKKLHYRHGKFFNASLDKASEYNERQSILLELENNNYIAVVQIAGLIARRIVCDLKEGQNVSIGERFGIIKFGSKIDIYLPIEYDIKVLEGQTMIGGESIIAKMNK